MNGDVRIGLMGTGVAFQLSPGNWAGPERAAVDRNASRKHAWQAWIVLLGGDGVGTMEIMRRTARLEPTVWRWRERFAIEGVGGLLRDETRSPGKALLAASVIQRVATKATGKPPAAAHWSARAMAGAVGIAIRPAQTIRQARGLKPHLPRGFKLSGVFKSVIGLEIAILS